MIKNFQSRHKLSNLNMIGVLHSKRKRNSVELIAGGLILMVFLSIAIASPWIAPPIQNSPYKIPRDGFSRTPLAPSETHSLGTLPGQYDIFYGIIWGTRLAFILGVVIVTGRLLIGTFIGLVSGYLGGIIDAFIMRITDAFLAFPIIAVVAVMVALAGQFSLKNNSSSFPMTNEPYYRIIIITLIIFGWMQYARLIRGNVLVERGKEYILAAIATGASGWRIIFRYLLPNVTLGLFVLSASEIGGMVVLVASIYYIGLAVSTSGDLNTDWGQMLSVSRDWVVNGSRSGFEYWYTYIPVCLVIIIFSTSWNLFGEGLKKRLDPKFR